MRYKNSLGEFWVLRKDSNWLTEYRLRKLGDVNTGFTLASNNKIINLPDLKKQLEPFVIKCRLMSTGPFVYEHPRTFWRQDDGFKEFEASFWFDNEFDRDVLIDVFNKL